MMYRIQDDIVTRHLKWAAPWGYLKIYPKVGYFLRDLRNVGTDGVTGRYGGPYGAAFASFSMGEVTPEFTFMRRLGLELTAQAVRISTASSAAFAKGTETYYEGTLSLLLYESEKSSWKPSVGISRVVGSDPVANLPHKVQTAVTFRVGYGL